MSNLITADFDVICLSETWLCDGIPNSNYFTPNYNVYRRDRDYISTGQKLGGGVLIALHSSLESQRRFDLESYSECLWVEIKTADGFNYLIGNYYFPPLCDSSIFIEHLETLEQQVNFDRYRVQMYGDFNLPEIDWSLDVINGGNLITSNKAAGLLSFIHFCGLNQLNSFENSAGNVLDLVLSNIPIESISTVSIPLVQMDVYHPPLNVQIRLPRKLQALNRPSAYCNRKGNYLGMYKYLHNYNWSAVLAMFDTNLATEAFTSVVQDAISIFVPKRNSQVSNYPDWFSNDLKMYLKKKIHFHRIFKKTDSYFWYTQFSIYRSLVKKLYSRDKQLHLDDVERSLNRHPKFSGSLQRSTLVTKHMKFHCGIVLLETLSMFRPHQRWQTVLQTILVNATQLVSQLFSLFT